MVTMVMENHIQKTLNKTKKIVLMKMKINLSIPNYKYLFQI